MVFGHNTNVTIGADTVHVQTEDRGAPQALIDTTVHWKGRVLHRRSNQYKDLLPLDDGREQTLKARVDAQHRSVVDDLRSGALKLEIPSAPAPAKKAAGVPAPLRVDLTNARTWLSGRNATLQLLVRDSSGNPVPQAAAKARVEGALGRSEFSGETGEAGLATLQFEMPKIGAGEAALVIEVAHNGAQGQLRFQLRAKPRA
jgi:hypothetical protein